MKILPLTAFILTGSCLISGQAFGVSSGALTLTGGETKTVDIGPTARNMRVCNDFFSAGPIVVTIDSNLARDLPPGVCAEDIGDRLTIQSRASGPAIVAFRAIGDVGIFAK
jgi:hypothetical protein